MKPCDLETGGARLQRGLKDVYRVWEEASESWDDGASRAVFEEHLEPMAPVVKGALDAVSRMRQLLQHAQRDLEG